MNNIWFVIGAAALATYTIRVLPVFVVNRLKLSPFWKNFLELMPLAALGALILPGAFLDLPGHWGAVLLGLVGSALIAWWRGGLILPVLTQVLLTFIGIQYL